MASPNPPAATIAETDRASPARWAPSPVRLMLRRPRTYWTLAAVLALATGLATHRTLTEVQRRHDAWGPTTTALVTTRTVDPGTDLGAATESIPMPKRLVPSGALTDVPPGTVAAHVLPSGIVVTASAVAAGAIEPDRAAIAVPRSASTPPLWPGARVAVVVNADPFSGLEPRLIDAVVVQVDDAQVVISVGRDDLIAATAAVQAGSVTLARTAS